MANIIYIYMYTEVYASVCVCACVVCVCSNLQIDRTIGELEECLGTPMLCVCVCVCVCVVPKSQHVLTKQSERW